MLSRLGLADAIEPDVMAPIGHRAIIADSKWGNPASSCDTNECSFGVGLEIKKVAQPDPH